MNRHLTSLFLGIDIVETEKATSLCLKKNLLSEFPPKSRNIDIPKLNIDINKLVNHLTLFCPSTPILN